MTRELDNFSEEPLITTYSNGKIIVTEGDIIEPQLTKNNERANKNSLLSRLGLVAIAGLTLFALKVPNGVDATAGSQPSSPLVTDGSTIHYPPADYYRWQDPNKAHLWVAVDETPPTPTATKPADYYSNPAYLTETPEATPTPTKTPPPPVDPGAYRTADPHNPNWAPVGEYWTPTPTKPAGYYTNPDLLIPTGTPVPTEQE